MYIGGHTFQALFILFFIVYCLASLAFWWLLLLAFLASVAFWLPVDRRGRHADAVGLCDQVLLKGPNAKAHAL